MKQVFLPLCPLNLKPETDVQVNRLHIEKGEEQRENFSLRKLKGLCLEIEDSCQNGKLGFHLPHLDLEE